MPSLDKFNQRIQVVADDVATGADRLTRAAALAVDKAVVMDTPVDSGRARSNWVANINGPANEAIDAYSPGTKGNTAAENQQKATDQAERVVASYKFGDAIHITNNLPYIIALNNGHSSQTAAGFVDRALQSTREALKGYRGILKG